MRHFLKLCFLLGLGLFSSMSLAGKDPIGWSLAGSLPQYVIAGRTYSVTYTLTNQLPFRLVKPIQIDKVASPSDEFTYTDECSGQLLAPQGTCTVKVTLVPQAAGTKSVQIIIAGYDNNRVALPVLTSSTQGSDPVLSDIYASVTQSFPANLAIGHSSNYGFSFTNRSNADITGVSLQVSQTSGTPSYTTNCTTQLDKGKSCVVTGGYIPSSSTPISQSVTATMNYSGTKSVQASTAGSVTSSSGVQAAFVVPYSLPAEMVGGAGASSMHEIEVRYTNNTNSTITISTSTLQITTGGGSANLVVDPVGGTNNCTLGAATLGHGDSCIIKGELTVDPVVSDTQVVVTGEITYTGAAGSPVSIATSTYILPAFDANRTITLLNNCDFPVWFSFSGASAGNCPCPSGQTCGPKNQCFWNNPAPNVGTYELAPSGGTTTATLPFYGTSTDPALQWSGAISASVRCDTGGCLMASCDNNSGTTACAVGKGFVGPATLAEMTFNMFTGDSYDVSVINGFHIPVTITPGSHTTPNNYTCGVAASFASGNGFGACNWETATPPNNSYYVVTPGGQACNVSTPSTPACPTNQVCGLASTSTDGTVIQSCGYFLGYWTATEICGSLKPTKGSDVDVLLGCTTPLPASFAPYGATTNTDLMLCKVPTGDPNPVLNSCYNSYASQYDSLLPLCCGCKDWWEDVSGVNSTATSCNGVTDPTWNAVVQPKVQWIKAACPSSYVYQFDDKTSGFGCSTAPTPQQNYTNYTIEFCQGNTGKHAGIYDGRKNPPAPIKAS